MFKKSLTSIVGESFMYPFENVKSLILPFVIAVAMLTAVHYLFSFSMVAMGFPLSDTSASIFAMNDSAQAVKWDAAAQMATVRELVEFFIGLLVLVPILVAVARHVILGEGVADLIILKAFNGREMSNFRAWLKLYILASAIPFVALIIIFIVGFMIMMLVAVMGQGAGFSGELFMNQVAVMSMILVGLYLVVFMLIWWFVMAGGGMAGITSAIDQGNSVRQSFRMTKDHVYKIFFILIALFVLLIPLWIIVYLISWVWLERASEIFMNVLFQVALAKVYLEITAKE